MSYEACRFLPTCSQYGVQAIEEFGPQKGVILTAWRILRCSPLGGKGYDPPRCVRVYLLFLCMIVNYYYTLIDCIVFYCILI